MYIVDLNSDIGESFGTYKLGLDHEVREHITYNICLRLACRRSNSNGRHGGNCPSKGGSHRCPPRFS